MLYNNLFIYLLFESRLLVYFNYYILRLIFNVYIVLIMDVGTFSKFLIFIVSSRPYWKPAGVFTLLNRLA